MEIRLYGDPVLRRVAEPIEHIDEDTRQLAHGMIRALTLAEGYGLAAPQVGMSKRVIVLDVEEFFDVLVNPEVTDAGEDVVEGTEGCLSIPGGEAEVPRRRKIAVRGVKLDGTPVSFEAEDLLARVIQHEIDHLDGVLFIDHLGEAKRLQVLKDFERKRRERSGKAKAGA